jgi:uncharacterized membrane protein YhaH (DUF805 family)
MTNFFTGRSGRQEYWISVALLIVVALVLNYFNMQAASVAITIMWILTWIRRLHDIGKPGWLAILPLGAIILLAAGGLALGGEAFVTSLEKAQASGGAPPLDRNAYIFLAILIGGLIVQFGFTIWLGAKKGDEGGNKFGPPPSTSWTN